MNPEFDIVILGGGLVGSSLACALDGHGWRVALVEASEPNLPAPGFDERKLALAAASVNALAALGVLGADVAGSPIRRIHVSRAGDFGAVRLAAADRGLDSFGAVLTARELGGALERRLAALSDVQLLRPMALTAVQAQAGAVQLQLNHAGQSRALSTRLLVAADGTRSFARRALAIEAQEHDYQQTLLVCSVATDRDADGTAYERFTDSGPVALLPMGRQYGAVCAVSRAQAGAVGDLDDAQFADYLQQRFGWRAGRIRRVGQRRAYPVFRVIADRLTAPRSVLIGNAAQTIHPIGAQGFNLGLRDALTLAEVLRPGDDPGAPEGLARYVEAREADRSQTLAFSDGLARATANATLPMQVLRSLGLLSLSYLPGLAAPLVSGAMGFRGRVPLLARAQP